MCNNTCFCTCSYSVGTHHGHLHQSLVILSRVTCFIPRETAFVKTNTVKKWGGDLAKMKVKWNGKVEIRTGKKFLAVGEAFMAMFWPTPSFKGRTFFSSEVSTEWAAAGVLWRCYLFRLFSPLSLSSRWIDGVMSGEKGPGKRDSGTDGGRWSVLNGQRLCT